MLRLVKSAGKSRTTRTKVPQMTVGAMHRLLGEALLEGVKPSTPLAVYVDGLGKKLRIAAVSGGDSELIVFLDE